MTMTISPETVAAIAHESAEATGAPVSTLPLAHEAVRRTLDVLSERGLLLPQYGEGVPDGPSETSQRISRLVLVVPTQRWAHYSERCGRRVVEVVSADDDDKVTLIVREADSGKIGKRFTVTRDQLTNPAVFELLDDDAGSLSWSLDLSDWGIGQMLTDWSAALADADAEAADTLDDMLDDARESLATRHQRFVVDVRSVAAPAAIIEPTAATVAVVTGGSDVGQRAS